MRKLLIIVEDLIFSNVLKNFFVYLKFPVRVCSANAPKFRTGMSEDIILNAHAEINFLPLFIAKVRSEFPNVRVLCLIKKKGSKVQKAIGKKRGHYFLITQDLMRIYKMARKLRAGGQLKTQKTF